MAQFVMAKLNGGPQVWINADQIRFVFSQDNGRTTLVHFDKDDSIAIEGPPAIVLSTTTK
jgi:hypothetical protein